MKQVLYLAALTLGFGVGSETASADVPRTLKMRGTERVTLSQARKAQQRRPLRTAQQPEPTPTPTPTDQAPTPEPAPPATPPAEPAPEATPPAPGPEATPAPGPETPPSAEGNLSDAELAKLAEQAEATEEVIVVTGSNIERKELTTTAPVTIVDKADLEAAGKATVGEILQNLPAQSNAINAQFNNGGDGAVRVDIRGLGANRTLVLLNGRRVVSGGTGADSSVDLNQIPLAMIERVEVLKDGASAVYGSDAIGGVVNIITRQDFTGTEVSAMTAVTQRADGLTYDLSMVSGHATKKGHILFSAGIQSTRKIMAGDRSFSEVDKTFDFTSGTESKSGSAATPGGRIDPNAIDTDPNTEGNQSPNLCGTRPNAMGQEVPIPCKPDGNGGWLPFNSPDDLYNFQPENYLLTPSRRYNVMATGSYNLNEGVKAFFEGSYLNRQSQQQLAPEPFAPPGVPIISAQSIYNPTGFDLPDFRRRLEEFGTRDALQNIDTFRIVTGLSGKIGEAIPFLKDWKWEVSYNYGRTTGLQRNEGNLILSRIANAIGPSFIDGNGVARCGTRGAPGMDDQVIDGCVPLNLIGKSGAITSDMVDYVTFTAVNMGINDQKTALAQASGRIAKLPNKGDISLGIGADWRREEGSFTPDPLTSTGDTTGNSVQPTAGSYDVIEGYAELSIVPVSGQKFAEWVELNLAARAFNYDTFGSGVTWKAGGLFKTAGGVALRGTYSTAFRAPAISELFSGKFDNFASTTDPCSTHDGPLTNPVTIKRCAEQGVPTAADFDTSQQLSINGGNEDLDAETAKVITAGIVFEPPQVKGLSLTVDYFNVKIEDAITSLGAQVILANCYTRDQADACAAVTRDPSLNFQIASIDDPLTNVGSNETDGVDFALAYNWKSAEFGKFRHGLEGQVLRSYIIDNEVDRLQGVGYYDLGVYPRLKANLQTMWDHKGVNAGFNVRYVHKYKECDDNDCNTDEKLEDLSRNVKAYVAADLFGGYTVKSKMGTTRLGVGMNNLTDAKPPVIYIGSQGDSDASTYDYLGRYFYARLTQTF